MSLTRKSALAGKLTAVLVAAMYGHVATAQQTSTTEAVAPAPDNEEIIVTARKRAEREMDAPVVMTVISQSELKNLNINALTDLGEVTPGLQVQRGIGGQVGAVTYLRGIGSGTSAVYIDQSVGMAIDGVGFSHGSMFDLATFDLAQVEVLKGPQGLFFGKSTTAGIISFVTADPTREWETEASAGYEFTANELTLNGRISGPLSDSLGIRVAGFYRRLDGYFYNPDPTAPPSIKRGPNGWDAGGRLTLTHDGGASGLRAKFKLGYTATKGNGTQQMLRQAFSCPTGQRQMQLFAFDNCRLDDFATGETASPQYNPNVDWPNSFGNTAAFATGSPIPNTGEGVGQVDKKGLVTSLQLDYDLAEGLTLTSVTGFGRNSTFVFQQGSIGATTTYFLAGDWSEEAFSQEVRLASHWSDKWFNFMIGGLYAPDNNLLKNGVVTPINTTFTINELRQKGNTTSVFGQLLLTPVAGLEISGGVRYTHIHRYFDYLSTITNVPPFNPGSASASNINQAPLLPYGLTNIKEGNTSPEFTVSYRPTPDLTIFGSYKWGYKGPGFNASSFLQRTFLVPNSVSPFNGERVRGFEGGVKASLLDRQLDVSLAGYHYRYLALQVSSFDPVSATARINNGADALTKGVEFEATFRPRGLEGLKLSGALAYTDSRFGSFPFAPCWGGQTAATGCVVTAGVRTQDLGGRRLSFAPKWVGSLDASYRFPVGDDYSLTVGARTNFSSGYYTVATLLPNSYQRNWANFDASLRFGKNGGDWELALIGRNLTNNYHVVTGFDAGTVIPGTMADAWGIAARPRQIMVQATIRPGIFH